MAHMRELSGEYGQADLGGRLPSVQDLDVTVLAFAQWLSEMRSRSNSSLQQMLAEMGIIRNGITSNNTDLTEFKRNTATVQQQMQSQISDLRDKLTDAYTEIANMKKSRSGFEQEIHAEYQSVSEQLQFKTLEMETLKKAYAHTHQQLQGQIIQLQTEVNELRLKGDDAHKLNHLGYEQNLNKVSEIETTSHYTSNEVKRMRSDHDQAIANLADGMTKWNDTLRDLSKEFHDFQKVQYINHTRLQSAVFDIQGKAGVSPGLSGGMHDPAGGGRMESGGGGHEMAAAVRSAPQAASRHAAMLQQGGAMQPTAHGAIVRAQSPGAGPPGQAAQVASADLAALGTRRATPSASPTTVASPYPGAMPGQPPPQQQQAYVMR